MLVQYFLSISGIVLLLETDQCLLENDSFRFFLTDASKPDFKAVFRKSSMLPSVPEKVLFPEPCYGISKNENGNFQKFFYENSRDPVCYAVAEFDAVKREVSVSYLEEYRRCVSEIRNSFFHVGFEEILLQREKMYLHASCVETELGGLLFSGVSGIGKSTQANLWCSYRKVRQINGDRTILSREGKSWFAWGSPYAGSSRCYVNDSCPVTAILLLKQGTACTLRRMTLPEAFRGVWAGLTVHSWDPVFVDKASSLTLDLIQSVAVFEFCCTPDVEAVEYLEQELRKEFGV